MGERRNRDMNRRTFLQAAGATVLLPMLPAVGVASKAGWMTLERFCRDVLKVELSYQSRDVAYIIDQMPLYTRISTFSNIIDLKFFRKLAPDYTVLAACVALWTAYVTETNVWIHETEDYCWVKMWNLVWEHDVKSRLCCTWYKHIWRNDGDKMFGPDVKPEDFHIYV